MSKLYSDQRELDQELADLQGVFGEHPCELVEGEVPPADVQTIPVDQTLKAAIKKQLALLNAAPTVPRFVLYQLSTGQRSMICIGKNVSNEFVFSYRDFDSRPPTKRVKDTIQEAIDEFEDRD